MTLHVAAHPDGSPPTTLPYWIKKNKNKKTTVQRSTQRAVTQSITGCGTELCFTPEPAFTPHHITGYNIRTTRQAFKIHACGSAFSPIKSISYASQQGALLVVAHYHCVTYASLRLGYESINNRPRLKANKKNS